MKQLFLFILLFIASLQVIAQEEEMFYDIILPSQDEFIAKMYASYKEGFEKYCDQQFMTEEVFRDRVLKVNQSNSKEFANRESETYIALNDAFEKNVVRKFKNLDVYYTDEDLDETSDNIRLTTKVTSVVAPYNGGFIFGVSKFVLGCKGSIHWDIEIYKEDVLVAKGVILTVVVKNEYEEPLQVMDHKALVKGLKGVGVK